MKKRHKWKLASAILPDNNFMRCTECGMERMLCSNDRKLPGRRIGHHWEYWAWRDPHEFDSLGREISSRRKSGGPCRGFIVPRRAALAKATT